MSNRIYTTVQGDTFDIAAYKIWGNEMVMHYLVKANPEHQDTVFFPAGVQLVIPDVPNPVKRGPVPPWQEA